MRECNICHLPLDECYEHTSSEKHCYHNNCIFGILAMDLIKKIEDKK